MTIRLSLGDKVHISCVLYHTLVLDSQLTSVILTLLEILKLGISARKFLIVS